MNRKAKEKEIKGIVIWGKWEKGKREKQEKENRENMKRDIWLKGKKKCKEVNKKRGKKGYL